MMKIQIMSTEMSRMILEQPLSIIAGAQPQKGMFKMHCHVNLIRQLNVSPVVVRQLAHQFPLLIMNFSIFHSFGSKDNLHHMLPALPEF